MDSFKRIGSRGHLESRTAGWTGRSSQQVDDALAAMPISFASAETGSTIRTPKIGQPVDNVSRPD